MVSSFAAPRQYGWERVAETAPCKAFVFCVKRGVMKAIGLMSGTSMDGVDVALIETDGEAIHSLGPAAGFAYTALERQLVREAMDWARGIVNRADRSGVLSIAESMLTAKHAECVKTFASDNGIDLSRVDVVGFHGQTVLHRPERRLDCSAWRWRRS